MKKIILLFSFLLATFSWQASAQAVEDNFDGYTAGNDPTGWTKYQTETDDPGFIVTSDESNSAPNSLYHDDDNLAAESTSWIVAPVYTATGDDILEFFYRQNYTADYYVYSGVWYSTTGNDPTQNPGEWTQIAEFDDTDQPYSEDTWTQFTYNFTEAAGTSIYVAFKYTGDYKHEFYIDDFKIDKNPAVIDNFDSYTAGNDPTGWTKYQTETDDPGFIVTSDESNSAPNSLYHNDDNLATESTSWIVAPVYTATGDDMLEFFYRQNYTGSYYVYSGVWYSTTGNDPTQNPGEWTQIAEFNDIDQPYSEDAWTRFRHNFTEAAGTSIYVAFKYTGDFKHEFYIDDFKLMKTPAMVEPEFTLTVNPDCTNSQFSVDVNVTNLGGATSVTVTDDQGSASQQLTAVGNVSFGPYTSGTDVTFTVTNDQDTSLLTTDHIKYYCPPANDDCTSAEAFTLDSGSCSSSIHVDNHGTTDSGVPTPSCGDYQGTAGNGDLWYAITIPTDITEITLDVSNVDGLTSVAGALYSGDCSNLSEVSCTEFGSGWPWTISDLTSGDTYYLRVWDYMNNENGTFDLCGYYTPVSISENQIAGFKFYPNPVNHTLNLSAKDNIEMISISNVMGQEVLRLAPNTTETKVDMSQLQNGIYFVKAQVNGELTAFKVIKK